MILAMSSNLSSLAFLFLLAGSVRAQDDAPQPLWTVEGITEYRLENGLRVLLFPDPSKSTITVNATYMVGSRHEGLGEKGMAHLLEHMLFKGTKKFANLWGALEDHGANFNGSTWVDRTNYYETLPASDENLEFALALEADRMVNSRVAAEDLAKEFSVVRNEFEMGENDPVSILTERILSAAFLWHNYGFSTIGNESDIERVPVEHLRRFYEQFYQPDNALLVIAGEFEQARTLELVQKHFGAIPKPARALESTYTVEPIQDGARFVELERVGSVQAAGVAYHVCAGPHPDSAALTVLGEILTAEPAGRLYQALVPTDLATSVSSFYFPVAEPGAFMVLLDARTDHDIRVAHDTMIGLIEGLPAAEISAEELERAKTSLLTDIKLALADSSRIGIELSEWQAQGDWRLYFLHRDRLKEVTAADVERVAKLYFLPSNRTSGIFRPVDTPARAAVPATPSVEELVSTYAGSETIATGEVFEATPKNIETRTQRVEVEPGIRVALLAKEARGDQVVARMRFHYGSEEALKAHRTALALLPDVLMRGTKRLDYQALLDELDRQSSVIELFGEAGALDASITSDRTHLEPALRLLGEILRSPGFAPDQFEIVQKEALAALEESLTDPGERAMIEAQRCLRPFPKESFHYVPTLEEAIALLRGVTLDELESLHGQFLGADHAEAVLVGDFDPAQVTAVLRSVFGDWRSKSPYQRIQRPFLPAKATQASIHTPDKEMAIVCTGTTFQLRDDDPSFAALEFGNYILGQSAKSRLLNRLRHEGGLSYGAGSMLEVDDQDDASSIAGFAICAPENALKAQQAVREEFESWLAKGVTPEELVEGKQGYLLGFEGRLADDEFVAGTLLEGLETGRTFRFQEELLQHIQELTPEEIQKALQTELSQAKRFELLAGDMDKVRVGE